MQTELQQTPPKKYFNIFFGLDNRDFLISTIFALLLAVLALITCSPAEQGSGYSMMQTFRTERYSFSWILLSLIQFPQELAQYSFLIFNWIPRYTGYLGIIAVSFIPSFIIKLIVFYYLARFTRKIMGEKDTFLFRHLPSLSICVVSTCFIILYIQPACR